MISKCLDNKDIPIYGDGQNIRDWIYIDDHIDALMLVMSSGEIGNHYCIGSNQEHTNLDIASLICDFLDNLRPTRVSYSSLINFVDDRLGHDRRYAIDPTKIESDLKWFPKESFDTGIRKTIKFYYENYNL